MKRYVLSVVAALGVGGVIGYGVLGAGSNTSAFEGVEMRYDEHGLDPIRMCATDEPISSDTVTIEGRVPGFSTPQGAVDDYFASIQLAAELRSYEGKIDAEVFAELRELKAPTRELALAETPTKSDVVVFDAVSDGSDRIEARIIVEKHPLGGFYVETADFCSTALTADTDRFRELIRESVGEATDPGPEPEPEPLPVPEEER